MECANWASVEHKEGFYFRATGSGKGDCKIFDPKISASYSIQNGSTLYIDCMVLDNVNFELYWPIGSAM